MASRVDWVEQNFPRAIRWAESKRWQRVLILVTVLLLAGMVYEMWTEPQSLTVTLPSGDIIGKEVEIGALKDQITKLQGSSQPNGLKGIHAPPIPPLPKPTINNAMVHTRITCILRDPSKLPTDILISGHNPSNGSYLDGPKGKAYLQGDLGYSYRRTEEDNKALVIHKLRLPENSDLIGQPFASLRDYQTMMIDAWGAEGDSFSACIYLDITFRVNGIDVLHEQEAVNIPTVKGHNIGFEVRFHPNIPD